MQVKTKNLVVGVIAALLVLLLWYRVVYSSMQSSASKAKAKTEQANARVDALKAQLDAATKAKKSGPSASDLSNALPADPAEADFLRQVHQIALASGMDWTTIVPAPATPSGGLASVSVQITGAGPPSDVLTFVNALLSTKRLMVVDSVNLTAVAADSSKPGSSTKLQLQVSGRLFSQAPAGLFVGTGAAPAVGSTAPPAGAAAPTKG